jgi:hypothetical protein
MRYRSLYSLFWDKTAAALAWGSARQFATFGGATAACIRTSRAWLSLVRAESRDAKLAGGGAGEAERARDPGTPFQAPDANLAKFRTIAAIDDTDEHSGISSVCLAEFPALSGACSARGDTGLNLILVHGELSMTSGLPAK